METITKIWTAAKAKWTALDTSTKLLLLGAVAVTLGLALVFA